MTALIHNPPDHWVCLLRRGHKVWLVKEQEEAEIEFALDPPTPGYRDGKIGIRRQGCPSAIQSWYVSSNGRGIDNLPLLQPIEYNLLEPSWELLHEWWEHKTICSMHERMNYMAFSLDTVYQIDAEIFRDLDLIAGEETSRPIDDPCSFCNGTGRAIKPIER